MTHTTLSTPMTAEEVHLLLDIYTQASPSLTINFEPPREEYPDIWNVTMSGPGCQIYRITRLVAMRQLLSNVESAQQEISTSH